MELSIFSYPSPQRHSSQEMQVLAILSSPKFNSPKPLIAWHNFLKDCLEDFGIIRKITQSHYYIDWDKRGRVKMSAYEFQMATCIKELPWFIEQQTIVKIPQQTIVLLADEIFQFAQDAYWLLTQITSDHHTLYDPVNQEQWRWPKEGFSGIPFANLYQVNQKQLEAFSTLCYSELVKLFRSWLLDKTLIYHPSDPQKIMPDLQSFIPYLEDNLITYCHQFFTPKQYQLEDKSRAIEEAIASRYQDLLFTWKTQIGHWGLTLDTPVVKSVLATQGKRKYQYEFATVKQIIPQDDYYLIGLETEEICYLLPWTKVIGVWSKITYQFWTETLCVASSSDHRYFEAFIGFNSRGVAQENLKPIKRKLGWLELCETEVKPLPFALPNHWTDWVNFGVKALSCKSPTLQWRWYFRTVTPRHKTYQGFLRQIHKILTHKT